MPLSVQFPAFRLRNGRSITMEAIYRTRTYVHLLAGSPDRRINFNVIRRLGEIALLLRNGHGSPRPPLILPTPIWNLQWGHWEKADWYLFRTFPRTPRRNSSYLAPEWMPQFASVAMFSSDPISSAKGDYSVLPVIWFQESLETFFEEGPLEELHKVPWESAATDLAF